MFFFTRNYFDHCCCCWLEWCFLPRQRTNQNYCCCCCCSPKRRFLYRHLQLRVDLSHELAKRMKWLGSKQIQAGIPDDRCIAAGTAWGTNLQTYLLVWMRIAKPHRLTILLECRVADESQQSLEFSSISLAAVFFFYELPATACTSTAKLLLRGLLGVVLSHTYGERRAKWLYGLLGSVEDSARTSIDTCSLECDVEFALPHNFV